MDRRGFGTDRPEEHGNRCFQMSGCGSGAPRPAPAAAVWDDQAFAQRLAGARAARDDRAFRELLRFVAKSNYELIRRCFGGDVSQTDLVSRRQAKQRVQGFGREPRYTISGMMTGDALVRYARALAPAGGVVCALNFANGQHVGGGYLSGAGAQEEELCRQFPALYTSLNRAKLHGRAYPFGPPTCSRHDPGRYADVLYTPRLVARRASRDEGYRILEERDCFCNMSVVSAAAPNVKQGERFDNALVMEAMRTILIAPRLKDRNVETLVLGAWGCGAFGCDPQTMAALFARVLVEDGLGRLYKEVHFAIPPGNENARVFEHTLASAGLNLKRLL